MRRRVFVLGVVAGLLARSPVAAGPRHDIDVLRQEMRQLQEENRRIQEENQRVQERMKEVERKLEESEAAQAKQQEEVKTEIASAPRRYLERYFGEDRFVLTGWGSGTYEWQQNARTNTFLAAFVPIFLYRANDWILFEAEPEFELDSDGDTEVNVEYAQVDIVLNDYVTFVGGKFLLPFGEFIQQLHPAWINKLASNPLPYREGEEGGLMPFSNVGAELRGGAQLLGREGVDLAYTLYIANGPRFESDEVGAGFNPNNIDNNVGKGYGARFSLYPVPLSADLGRFQIGASTFDGKWDDSGDLWFTSWGIDTVYQFDELEVRGEYLQTYRQMPADVGDDNREGWYIQTSYRLARVPLACVNRLELIARYSGVNQRAVTDEELVPKPRQVALGVNYWLTPSVVGKLEYDRELPSDAPDDNAVRAQVAVGF